MLQNVPAPNVICPSAILQVVKVMVDSDNRD